MVLKLYSESIADIPMFRVSPGKLRDFPVHLGFTGSLASLSANLGCAEATMMEKPLSLFYSSKDSY